MTFQELQTSFGINNGQLADSTITLATGTYGSHIDDLIEYSYLGVDPVLSDTILISEDATAQTIVLSGKSDFLQMPDLPVQLTAVIDEDGLAQFTLAYEVLGATPDPVFWKLSKSVPSVPVTDPEGETTFNRTTGEIYLPEWHPLDKLVFYDTRFVVSSVAEAADPYLGYPMSWGTNFSSRIKAEGPLALISGLMGQTGDYDVTGTIRRPRQGETTAMLETPFSNQETPHLFPWDVKDQFVEGLPGVHLKVHLGFAYSLVDGEMDFAAEYLHMYTPYDSDWEVAETRPAFEPTQAFSGSLTLPNADITMAFVVPFDWGVDYLKFVSRIDGLSLSALGDLAGLTGAGEDLVAKLPDALQNLASGLGALSLTNLEVELDFRTPGTVQLPYLSFAIGMPDINWEIWPDHFSVNAIKAYFEFDYPFETGGPLADPDMTRALRTRIEGALEIEGKSFVVSAASGDNWTVYAAMAAGETLNLSNIINSFGDSVAVPDGLVIDLFRVAVSPGNSYNLAMGMAGGDNAWEIELGGQDVTISDVYVNLGKNTGQPATASIGGQLELGQLGGISVAYDSPGDVTMRAFYDELDLVDLAETLLAGALDLPDDLTFVLKDSSVLVEKRSADYSFLLATEVEGFGSLALQLDKSTGTWGIAFGMDLTTNGLSGLPGLSALSSLEGRGAPSQLLLIVSSIDRPNFLFPSLAQFENPKLNSNSIPVPSTGSLAAGLNLYAHWDFNSSDQGTTTLLDLLGMSGGLDVTISVPSDPTHGTRLYTRFDGKMLGKYDLDAQFGLQLSYGTPELFLGGTLTVPIEGQNCTFDVAMSVLHTGVYFSGSMAGSISFEGFQISNMGLMFGYNWALLPSIGVMASIDTADFHTSLAFLFDSGNPAKSVMAGAISDINLEGLAKEIAKADAVPDELTDVLSTISLEGINEFELDAALSTALNEKDHGTVAAQINAAGGLNLPSNSENLLIVVNKENEMWSLTDVNDSMKHYELRLENGVLTCKANAQIYLAPQGIALGGFTFNQGFRVMGALSILGLTWTTDIEIVKRKGIKAVTYLDDDLVIWNREFFQLSDTTGTKGPRFSLATFNRPNNPDPALRQAHFMLDGRLVLLGSEATAEVRFSTSKFLFSAAASESMHIHNAAFSGDYGVEWDVTGEIGKNVGISFAGSYDFNLSGKVDLKKLFNSGFDMGKVSFNLSVAAAVAASFDGTNGSLAVSGAFRVLGTEYAFDFSMDGSTEGLAKMGEKLLDEFLDIVKSLYDSAEKWVGEVGDSLEELGDEIAAVAEVTGQFFGSTAEEAAQFMKDLGADASRIATELYNNGLATTEQAIAETLQAIGEGATAIADALKNALSSTDQAVTNILKAIGYNSTGVGRALRDAYGKAGEAIAALLKNAGYDNYGIAWMFKNVFPDTPMETVTSILNSLGYNSTQIGRALKNAFQSTVSEVASLLSGIGYTAKGISWMVKNVYSGHALQDTVDMLRDLGYTSTQIGEGLRDVWKKTYAQVGELLQAAGFAADAISWMVKNVFSAVSAQDVADLLNSFGYNSTEIGRALKSVYNSTMSEIAGFLKNIGYTAEGIAWMIKNNFGSETLENATAVLKDLGYTAVQIGEGLRDVYKRGMASVAELLHGAGFVIEEIADMIKGLFSGATYDSITTVFKNLGYDATAIAARLAADFGRSAAEVLDLLRNAAFTANEAATALRDALGKTAAEVVSLMKAAGDIAEDIGATIRDVFNKGAGDVARLLKDAGFFSTDIANMLGSAFSDHSYEQYAKIFKDLGYNASTIATRLQWQFKRSHAEITSLLKATGFSLDTVRHTLEASLFQSVESITSLLKGAGYGAEEVANILYNTYSIASEDAGKFLVNAGYAAGDVAKMLRKDAFWDKGSKATGKILKKAGLGKSAVRSALKSAGWATKTVEDAINSIF